MASPERCSRTPPLEAIKDARSVARHLESELLGGRRFDSERDGAGLVEGDLNRVHGAVIVLDRPVEHRLTRPLCERGGSRRFVAGERVGGVPLLDPVARLRVFEVDRDDLTFAAGDLVRALFEAVVLPKRRDALAERLGRLFGFSGPREAT